MTPLFSDIFVVLAGLCLGSFLNVCRVRIPRDESIVSPRSCCRDCRTLVAWYDNIPLLSYIILRGRCRRCGARIAWQYPVVECLTALLVLAVWHHTLDPLSTVFYTLGLMAPLILLSMIDLEFMIIPDVISYPMMGAALIVRLWLGHAPWAMILQDALLGLLVGAGFLALVSLIYEWLRKKEGLGWGDVKLMASLGIYFGWQGSCVILLVSSVLGSVLGGLFLVVSGKDRQQPIPFGPFIALAAVLYFFYGEQTVAWYLSLFRR